MLAALREEFDLCLSRWPAERQQSQFVHLFECTYEGRERDAANSFSIEEYLAIEESGGSGKTGDPRLDYSTVLAKSTGLVGNERLVRRSCVRNSISRESEDVLKVAVLLDQKHAEAAL
jgi:hypothetical protein